MYRCVVLHRNGTSELQEVQPALHQKLRHLDYKRYVVEFVRDSDGISSTAPLYCQFAPSSWQASSAARQLWGRHSGTVRLFDEDGHLVQDLMATGGTPFQGSAAIPERAPSAPPAVNEASQASSPDSAGTARRVDDPAFTREDVVLVNALARLVQEPFVPDSAFGTVPRDAITRKIRDLAIRLSHWTKRHERDTGP